MPSPLVCDRIPFNAWDSFDTAAWHGFHVRLFGNANIGRMEHCNLQVPGVLAVDETVMIEHLYARTDAAPRELLDMLELHAWASNAIVRLSLCDKPVRVLALSELLQDRPWEPSAVALDRATELGPDALAAYAARLERRQADGPGAVRVPPRQDIRLEIEAWGDPPKPPARIWIHLEGHRLQYRRSV